MNSMNYFTEKLKAYFHDSFDKCFDIPGHEKRAQKYANLINIGNIKEAEGADRIASCMERSLLPKEKLIQEFNEIRHPLCEGVLKVDLKPPLDKILIIYDEIKNKIPNEENDKFLYIWRNIQEIAFKTLKDEEVAKYISILPADTRIPDHSIWEHLKITSAINAFWDGENRILYQNNSLLLFTIGPVQSFISQARKTIDFFMGSYILSYLTFIAMKMVIEKYGPTSIIYPDLYKQTLMDNFLIKKGIKIEDIFDEKTLLNPTIPNRFVSILPETEETKIKEIAQLIEINIKETLNEAINIIFNELSIRPNEKHKIKIDSQISEFPEIYWTSIPWRVNGRDIVLNDLSLFFKNDFLKGWEDLWGFAQKRGEYLPNIGFLYEVIYSALEKSMGGRKKLREFGQFKIEEKGRKCSVCGERDVIFFNEKENKKKFITYNDIFIDLTDEIEKGVIPLRFLANGEGLCSICFLKRTFEIYLKNIESNIFENFFFPSIAEIASSDFKESAILKASKEYFDYQEEIKNTFGIKFYTQKVMPLPKLKFLFEEKINLDGEWFYEENLRREYFEKEFGISLTEEQIQILKEKYKRLIDQVGKPNSYYAIIHFDADNMGKWLSGNLLPTIKEAYNTNIWKELERIKIEENGKIISFADFLNSKFCQIKGVLSNKPLTPAIHASISTALRNYTEFVREIIEKEHLGKIIYAGGDDILALVNLKDLLDVIKKLRWAFSGQIKIENNKLIIDMENKTGFVLKDGKYLLTMGPKAKASAGVVIAHYKTPLQIVIRKVFEMEKEAKKIDGKNAFSICFMRRSGEERTAKTKWFYEDSKEDTIELLKSIQSAFKEDEDIHISSGFIYKLSYEFQRLKNETGLITEISEDIFNMELKRLLDKSYNGPKKEKRNFINRIYNQMKDFFWSSGGNLDIFINFCIILKFITKGED